ncbi:TOMM precursor leader peptide-binding protein [Asticcacaulis taihuensis]|uniref:TOMM precursor leader peptide-binding protein n=1 Tax=Asticcacaulis taihuensis TaxID=260084 RepID=UPI003F7BCCE8
MADDKLRIDPAVDVVGGPDRIRFITPRGGFALRDPNGLAQAITNKCRQGDAPDDIISACTEDTERAATKELLGFLQTRNILGLETAQDQSGDISKAWLRHYATSRDTPIPAVEVRGAGRLAQSLKDKLAVAGMPQAINRTPTCVVAAFDTPQLNTLRQINLDALNNQVAFLPVWLERSTVRWGPMTLPGATGCLECLLHRRHNNERRADPVEAMDLPELSVSPLLCEFAAMLAVGEIQRWALDAYVDTDLGVAWHFDWLTMQMSGSRVLRLPRCPACGLSRAL